MIAYLILVHKNPAQITRLVGRLRSPKAHFFIHVEKKVDGAPFYAALSGSDIHWVDRHAGEWGFLGIVLATLAGMKTILDHPAGFERIVLLSGQDYPLRPVDAIEDFFKKAPDTNFIFHTPLPAMKDLASENGGMDRIEKYHFKWMGKRRVFPSGGVSDLFFRWRFPIPRRFPSGMRPYYGSQWWSLCRSSAEYVLDFVKRSPAFVRYYHHCYIPDEMFFQTILMNSPHADRCDPDDLRYSNWTKPNGPVPAVLLMEDLEDIRKASQRALFARKFDMEKDSEILDRLDAGFQKNH